MSLRSKIILLFIGLAVAPLLVLAGYGYWQAQILLESTLQGQLTVTVTEVGRVMAGEREEIRTALVTVGQGLSQDSLFGSDGEVGSPSDRFDGPLGRAAFIRWLGGQGQVRGEIGAVPNDRWRITPQGASALVRIRAELPPEREGESLTAGFWASDLIPNLQGTPGHFLMVFDTAAGAILLANSGEEIPLEDLPGALPEELARMMDAPFSGPGTFEEAVDGERRLGAFAPIPESGWVVLGTANPAEVVAPLNNLVTLYWAFVAAVALSTALAFSVLLGRFTRSLGELARAAEQIREGELDPWLPLPTSGEVGQVTLALNRMLVRMQDMMSQVNQSGRLAVVGQLSAYFAHEIRNPLSSIKMNLQRLQRWVRKGDLPEFCSEPVEISLREVERLSASVSDVLQLSRTSDSPQEVVSIHHQVEEARNLLLARFQRQGVELRLDLDAQADRILARAGQIKSVILNLMVNALEIQPEGGHLEIRSELVGLESGPGVAVHFRDGGPGVPPDDRDRIFEPFFTTKTQGSGIGLAVASRCVSDNQGHLYLAPAYSLGSGAEFVMVFPLAPVETRSNLVEAGYPSPHEPEDMN
jgi:signal transduction histidine kinase